ncbi:MAG TPA: hypothetical protein VGM46_02880, partial [Mesorhizobium sp.]
MRDENRSGNSAALSRGLPGSRVAFRWMAISGAGIGLALLSTATVAGLVFLGASIASPPHFSADFSKAQQAAMPDRLMLATTLSSPRHGDCQFGCTQRAQYIVQQAKSPRTARKADAQLEADAAMSPRAKRRFDKARALLTHGKLAAAFARSTTQMAELNTALPSPLKNRFYPAGAKAVSLLDGAGPAATRFGPQVAEVERSSRLALALAGSAEIQVAYATDAAALVGPSMPVLLQDTAQEEASVETADAPVFELVPDSAPLPARRPKMESQMAAIVETAPRQPAIVA